MDQQPTNFRGIARNVQRTSRSPNTIILSFRLEQTNDKGHISRYIPVQLTASKIQGTLTSGNEVEVTGQMNSSGQIFKPETIVNLSTQTPLAWQAVPAFSLKNLHLFPIPFLLIFTTLIMGVIGFSIHTGQVREQQRLEAQRQAEQQQLAAQQKALAAQRAIEQQKADAERQRWVQQYDYQQRRSLEQGERIRKMQEDYQRYDQRKRVQEFRQLQPQVSRQQIPNQR